LVRGFRQRDEHPWPTPIHTLIVKRPNGETTRTAITDQAKARERFHYIIGNTIAEFLHGVGQSLEKSWRQPSRILSSS